MALSPRALCDGCSRRSGVRPEAARRALLRYFLTPPYLHDLAAAREYAARTGLSCLSEVLADMSAEEFAQIGGGTR